MNSDEIQNKLYRISTQISLLFISLGILIIVIAESRALLTLRLFGIIITAIGLIRFGKHLYPQIIGRIRERRQYATK